MPSFFESNSKKRKRPDPGASSKKPTRTKSGNAAVTNKRFQQRKPLRRDEELDSDDTHTTINDADLRGPAMDSEESDREEYANETPADKRLRLARIYLNSVKEGLAREDGEYDAAEIDREIISARLKEDVLENAGKLHIFIADSIQFDDPSPSRLRIKCHRMAVTSAIISHDGTRVYMAGKEGGVSCNDAATGKPIFYTPKQRPHGSAPLHGHSDEVLALALSGDGKYLASAGKDRTIGIWDVGIESVTSSEDKKREGLVWVKGFSGHKDTISALSFRKATNTLYSASFDRTLRLFDLSPGVMGHVETLFGHQDSVSGLDSLKGDTAVSCGGRDRTVRFWKITEETQLVFRGGGTSKARDLLEGVLDEEEDVEEDAKLRKRKGKEKEKWVEGSVDCVAMVDEQTFLSGGDSGSIALWSTNKKKPIFTYTTAHGVEVIESSTEGKLRRPRWIMSLACLRYGDLFASGSWDGYIRFWKLDHSLRSFSPIGSIDTPGLINSLQLVETPKNWTFDDGWPAPPNGTSAMKTGITPHKSIDGGVSKSESGVLLVAAVGQEPRLGRWIRLSGNGVVNSGLVVSLRTRKTTTASG